LRQEILPKVLLYDLNEKCVPWTAQKYDLLTVGFCVADFFLNVGKLTTPKDIKSLSGLWDQMFGKQAETWSYSGNQPVNLKPKMDELLELCQKRTESPQVRPIFDLRTQIHDRNGSPVFRCPLDFLSSRAQVFPRHLVAVRFTSQHCSQ
jgi:hypothetical protein